MSNIQMDDLADAIAKGLLEYTEEVTEKVHAAVDEAADRCNEEIKSHLTEGHGVGKRGRYKKSFRLKTTEKTKYNKKKTWYVKSPEYRLTHLLEKGHALRQGGRAQPVKHIEYGERIAEEVMMELCEKAVKAN